LTDECGAAASVLATPLWMFTGDRQPWKWVPRAGIADAEILAASRFGEAMRARLQADAQPLTEPMLRGLGAVQVDEKLIASERVGSRSFHIWGRLIRALGPQEGVPRRIGLIGYVVSVGTLSRSGGA